MTSVLFTFAAMAGALVRVALRDRFGRPATTAVNLLGSFLLGLVIAGGLGDNATTIIGTGFCGSLTTMSGIVSGSFGDGQTRAQLAQSFLAMHLSVASGLALALCGYLLG